MQSSKSSVGNAASSRMNDEKKMFLIPPAGNTEYSQSSNNLTAPLAGNSSNLRNKVALKPGRSLLDWIKLGRSGKDLSGTNGKVLRVTADELSQHNKEDDAWVALYGKVYNVTPYLEFHPGGIPELMRGAGTDCTNLFNEIHKWVNYDSMLAKCLVGMYVPPILATQVVTDKRKSISSETPSSVNSNLTSPRYTWTQTDTTITISVCVENGKVQKENVIIDRSDQFFNFQLLVNDHVFHVEQELEDAVGEYRVEVDADGHSVNVILQKKTSGKTWENLGINGSPNSQWKKQSDEDISFRRCIVKSVSSVTHDTKLFSLEYPEGTHMIIPVGCHVFVSKEVGGHQVSRPYTVIPPSLTLNRSEGKDAAERVVHLMVKIYPNGLLTPSLDNLKPGDGLDISTRYAGNFKKSCLDHISHLIMYAAGTGFTPMAGLLHHCLTSHDTSVLSRVQLVFFNKDEKDILWRKDLDQLSSVFESFRVHYVLSDPNPEWNGLRGRIQKELMESLSPKPENVGDVLFCVCGPVQFTQKVIRFAGELGYTDNMIHAFTS